MEVTDRTSSTTHPPQIPFAGEVRSIMSTDIESTQPTAPSEVIEAMAPITPELTLEQRVEMARLDLRQVKAWLQNVHSYKKWLELEISYLDDKFKREVVDLQLDGRLPENLEQGPFSPAGREFMNRRREEINQWRRPLEGWKDEDGFYVGCKQLIPVLIQQRQGLISSIKQLETEIREAKRQQLAAEAEKLVPAFLNRMNRPARTGDSHRRRDRGVKSATDRKLRDDMRGGNKPGSKGTNKGKGKKK